MTRTVLRWLAAVLVALLPLAAAAPAARATAAAERPDCPAAGPAAEALCPCLIQQRWREAGSVPDADLAKADCAVEIHDAGAAVLAVGGYELDGISYYLAIPSGEGWDPLARLGEKSTPGAGGHYSEFEVESVRLVERGAVRLLRVESRSSDGYWHFDGSSGSTDVVRVTLCRLPGAAGEPAGCPLQAPILIAREWTDPDEPADGAHHEANPGAAGPANPGETGDDASGESELDDRPHEETVRLEIHVGGDGQTAEVVLVEGVTDDAEVRGTIGSHPLIVE